MYSSGGRGAPRRAEGGRLLRVLHVICDLAGGGAERLVLDLCRLHGPEVAPEVMTVHDGGALEADFRAAGVRVRSAGRRRGGPGALALARVAAAAREVDLVHTHLWAGDLWGRLGGMLAGRPLVRSEHNTSPDSRLRGWVTRALDPRTGAVVAVSAAAARSLAGSREVLVIPNGVDTRRFGRAPWRPGPAGRVLGLGRLVRQKGFDVLVEAAARVPGLAVDLVGEGEERPRLAAPHVHLHGWVPDVAPWLARAEMIAIPSRWEGFGLVAVEAMASGVPVVASRVDGLEEVVGSAGLLVPPEDPASLARALGLLAADADLRAELARRGLARAADFDVRATVAAYEDLYSGLVKSARGIYN